MKVLQISPVAPPQLSGMSNAAGEICKATSGLGLEVSLVAAVGDSTVKDLRHFRIPGLGFLAFTPGIIKLARKADLIHLHYPCYGNAMMVSLAYLFGCRAPLVISYHMDTVGKGMRKAAFWMHRKIFGVHILRRAEKIVVASRDYAEHSLLVKYPELMEKVLEVPFGVDCGRFHPAMPSPGPMDIGPPLPLAGEGKSVPSHRRILFVGALDEQHYFKGLSFLIEAVADIPDAGLTVVGGGELLEYYRKQAELLGVGGRMKFAGRVSDEELPEYYRTADIYCGPSIDRSEAYGISIMEAAASGLPAITTDIPGVRSVVKNGETGILVPSEDVSALKAALESLLSDPQKTKKMGAAARELALTRTWAEAGEKYMKIYNSVV